jgi:uncharacterized protein YggE
MNTPTNFWKASTVAVILLTVFLAVLSLKEIKSIAYVGKSDQIINTISVSGTGDAFAAPDVANISYTVTFSAKTIADAQAQTTTKSNAALKILKDAGVEDKDIQTTSYNINPHYDYQQAVCSSNYCPPSKSVLSGYDVSQSTSVKIRNLDKAGSVLTSLGTLGVQNLNGLNFTVDKIEDVRAQARNKAIAMAQAKADTLAKQLGVHLVHIAGFYENGDQPIYYGMGGAKSMAVDAAPAVPTPELSTGEQKVTSNVTITYEIR